MTEEAAHGLFGPGIFGTGIDLSALDEDTAWRLGHFFGEEMLAAERRGWERAVAALRDEKAYQAWYELRIKGTSRFGPRPKKLDTFQLATAARYVESQTPRPRAMTSQWRTWFDKNWSDRMIAYDFPLRPDLTIRLILPLELSMAEAERLSRFVEALIMDDAPAGAASKIITHS